MPPPITYRRVKGVPLSNDEIDDNFENIGTDLDTKTTSQEAQNQAQAVVDAYDNSVPNFTLLFENALI